MWNRADFITRVEKHLAERGWSVTRFSLEICRDIGWWRKFKRDGRDAKISTIERIESWMTTTD